MILVTGATGTIGRLVVGDLLARGLAVRALTRDPARAGLPSAAEVVRGDLDDPGTLGAALRGVDRVLLVSVGPRAGAHGASLARAAAAAGTRHAVVLSSLAAGERSPTVLGRWHRDGEEAVAGGGLGWTVLRPGGFMSNALHWAPAIRFEGVVRAPFGRLAAAVVDPRDVAAAAASVLADGGADGLGGHHGRRYTLTGPEALTPVQQTAVLGRVLGSRLAFEELTADQARLQLSRAYPRDIVEALLESRSRADDDRAVISPDVQRVTGRAPRTFERWAADHRDRFTKAPDQASSGTGGSGEVARAG